MEKLTKINLACGKDYRDGYINVDNHSMFSGKTDISIDIFELLRPSNSADEILLLHFMMYIDPPQATLLFSRWYSWLKKGGSLIIETGDLKKIARNILETNSPGEINGSNGVVQLYGAAETAGHRWVWCADTLIPLLKYIGFSKFRIEDGGFHKRPERDLIIIATK